MLPFELGCIDDGNKHIVASKGAVVWRFRTRETEGREGPLGSNIVGANKGEITSITTKKGDVAFDNV